MEMVRSLTEDELADGRIIEKLAGDTLRALPRALRRPRRRDQERQGAGADRERRVGPVPPGGDVARPQRPRRDDVVRLDVQGPRRARRRLGRSHDQAARDISRDGRDPRLRRRGRRDQRRRRGADEGPRSARDPERARCVDGQAVRGDREARREADPRQRRLADRHRRRQHLRAFRRAPRRAVRRGAEAAGGAAREDPRRLASVPQAARARRPLATVTNDTRRLDLQGAALASRVLDGGAARPSCRSDSRAAATRWTIPGRERARGRCLSRTLGSRHAREARRGVQEGLRDHDRAAGRQGPALHGDPSRRGRDVRALPRASARDRSGRATHDRRGAEALRRNLAAVP